MRWLSLSVLLSCAAPAVPSPAPRTMDVPAHTQAMIDAYRLSQAQRPQAPKQAAPRCPGEDSAVQLRQKYLQAVDGCVEEGDPLDPTLAVGTPMQWPALYAALNAHQDGVDRCIRQAHTWFDLTGVMVTRVELTAEGSIHALRTVRDDAATPDVACCVRRELRRARLPAPGRPIALELETSFDPATLHERYSGTLGKEQLKAVMAAHERELNECYASAVQEGLHHEGRVTVRFVIGPGGDVSRASVVDDSVGSPSAACCFVQKLRTWQFPKPEKDGPVRVSYPFDIKLGG